jgi:hypothetical protein
MIIVFRKKNRFDRANGFRRQSVAIFKESALPPRYEKMTGRLVIHDKKSGRKRRIFVIIRNMLYLLSPILSLLLF